jgi:hypothetical protein
VTFASPPTQATYDAGRSVLAKNLLLLREMLANVAEVQSLFGGASKIQAAQRIYVGCLPRPATGDRYTVAELNNYRPFILIGPTGNSAITSRLELVGGYDTHGRQGAFDIVIERQHPTSGNDDENDLDWIDIVDMIRQSNDIDNPGLIELHEGPGLLTLRTVMVMEIYRGEEDEINSLGDYQRARMRVEWGRI